jgi:hypothetical protein
MLGALFLLPSLAAFLVKPHPTADHRPQVP